MKQKNIVLIGLPGCGKSTLGKKLAYEKKMNFIDLDEKIEHDAGMIINDIFAQFGEDRFRALETKASIVVSSLENTVISAGGGIIVREENMRALEQNGVIIFMNRDLAAIIKDIKTETRPLLKQDPNKITELYHQRLPLYRKYSDYEIANNSIETSLKELIDIADIANRTMRFAVIGDPIAHSKSPDIHLPVLQRLCRDATYERVQVKTGGLDTWMKRVRDEKIDGFNVTMPQKIDIIPYLDKIDADAKLYGAVNTVIRRGDKLYGSNTDGNGFLTMFTQRGRSFESADIVMLGAGGAATTIALKIANEKPKSVTVMARAEEKEKMQLICDTIKKIDPKIKTTYDTLTSENLSKYCVKANVLINATPIGMKDVGDEFENFEFLKTMQKDSAVCDLIYHPMETNLLKNAEQNGLNAIGGIGMLINQALLADEMYIDKKINLQAMQNRVIQILQREV